jgi:NAD(P)-dependent dehydrogenase (short-subunit alcohol dehydrogenase family)
MLLDGRNAVIYGGGGAIGGAVARAFAREGARVHLAGRTLAPLERVAEQVRAAGGVAETAVVDALDEGAVDQHADAVARGMFLTSRAAARHMLRQGSGVIAVAD